MWPVFLKKKKTMTDINAEISTRLLVFNHKLQDPGINPDLPRLLKVTCDETSDVETWCNPRDLKANSSCRHTSPWPLIYSPSFNQHLIQPSSYFTKFIQTKDTQDPKPGIFLLCGNGCHPWKGLKSTWIITPWSISLLCTIAMYK